MAVHKNNTKTKMELAEVVKQIVFIMAPLTEEDQSRVIIAVEGILGKDLNAD